MRLSQSQYAADRDLSRQAFAKVFSREPKLGERQFLQAVGCVETSGGRGWRWSQGAEAVNSNNIGAIQGGSLPCNPATEFETSDTHADGTEYRWCYKKYPTKLDGWVDLARTLYTGTHNDVSRKLIRQSAADGNFNNAVRLQRESGYFEAGLTTYQRAIDSCIREMSQTLGEPYLPGKSGISWPLILGISAVGIAGYYLWPRVTKESPSEQ